MAKKILNRKKLNPLTPVFTGNEYEAIFKNVKVLRLKDNEIVTNE